MISCKRSAALVLKSQDLPLRRKEKIQLKLHTKMCAVCKTFEQQTNLVEEVLKQRLSTEKPEDLSTFKIETITKLSELN